MPPNTPTPHSTPRPLSKHHFNSKHSLGVVNWHLPRRGVHKHSFINRSPLTFPLFICLPQSTPSPLPFPCLLSFLALLPAFSLSLPLPFRHHPPTPACFSPEDYTTYSHEYICVISSHAATSDLLKDPERGEGRCFGAFFFFFFCNAPSTMKTSI